MPTVYASRKDALAAARATTKFLRYFTPAGQKKVVPYVRTKVAAKRVTLARATPKPRVHRRSDKLPLRNLMRPSPAEHASRYKYQRLRGNDGRTWISKPTYSGIFRWQLA